MLEIRVLGPLEVVGPGGPVPIGRPMRRALLGLLALRARQVLSQEALIDGLWDVRPPPSALRGLHSHVAHLRRALDARGLGGLVGTRPPGYVLTVPPDQLDVDRFTRLIKADRAESPEAAARRLRAALDLWRGDVLVDCALGEWARAEANRLHELRLQVVEELCAADLALGGHRSVGAELEALVVRHPLRERLWELLVLALHRDGRRADALAAYRRARAVLAAELGVRPGPALRRLEALVLADDETAGLPITAAGGWIGGTAPRSGTPVTGPGGGQSVTGQGGGWQDGGGQGGGLPVAGQDGGGQGSGQGGGGQWVSGVPAPVTGLVGRDVDVAGLVGLLAERRLTTLTGVGGSGKTRLAIAVAEVVARDSAVAFVDLTATAEPHLLPAAVCEAVGVRENPTPAALVRALRSRRLLLVLDNCEHLAEACAALLATLLPSCPGLRVLATSIGQLGAAGETVWPVRPLPTPGPDARTLAELRRYDAVRLFLARAALPAVRDLTDADAPALAAVCAGLDGLPLALELAAARTAVLTVAEIAERLREPGTLRGPAHGRPHHRALDAALAWSYEALRPASRQRFRQLAVFAGGWALDAAAHVWSESEAAAVDVLAELEAKSLVVADRRGGRTRYRLLETLRHHAAGRLAAEPDEDRAARDRHAAHYLDRARETDRRLRGPDAAHWLDRLAADHENVRAALARHAARRDPDELTMAVALARYCRLRGRYAEGRRWLLDALERQTGATAAERAPAVLAVAFLSYFEGSYAEAARHANAALSSYREDGDTPAAARCLRLLGSIACERGEHVRAGAWYAEALLAYQDTDDDPGQADVLQMTGFNSWLAGALDTAQPLLERALRRYGALDDPENSASVRVHLAFVALHRGQDERARGLAEQALTVFTGLDFPEGAAWALNLLGLVELRAGRAAAALSDLHRSLEAHWQVGDRWRQAGVLDAMAAAHLALGDPTRAAELTGLATALRDDLGVPAPAVDVPSLDQVRAAGVELLGERHWHAAVARGAVLAVPDVVGVT
ncbi:BTAD domain-containing putative transcriptional regulator [Saccharothrix sp. HUAS TT1]|uniref:AfsR/SARP family transcriptional regulator n=1 Tax=unclassified Saccharothrix TaxID=2593673 RepID=UPI00345BB40E